MRQSKKCQFRRLKNDPFRDRFNNSMKRKTFTAFLVLIFAFAASAQTKEWQKQMKKIKPLITTEAEVETILGKPIVRFKGIGEYETKEGVFSITYSLGRCKSIRTETYNVEEGIVIQYDFRPKKDFKFNSLGIDMTGFKTDDDENDSSQTIEYYNLDKGITYDKSGDLLNWIQIYPGNDLDYLQCSSEL
jgi:hypothetical protein